MIVRVEGLDPLDKPQVIFRDDEKRDADYTVCKTSLGTSLWRVLVDKGPPPKPLEGNWTSMRAAEDAVILFLNSAKASSVISEAKAIKNLKALRQEKNAPAA